MGHFFIRVKTHLGFQICPCTTDIHHTQCQVGEGVKYAFLDWYIKNTFSEREMNGSGLIVYLIREHDFFKDSSHHIELIP